MHRVSHWFVFAMIWVCWMQSHVWVIFQLNASTIMISDRKVHSPAIAEPSIGTAGEALKKVAIMFSFSLLTQKISKYGTIFGFINDPSVLQGSFLEPSRHDSTIRALEDVTPRTYHQSPLIPCATNAPGLLSVLGVASSHDPYSKTTTSGPFTAEHMYLE